MPTKPPDDLDDVLGKRNTKNLRDQQDPVPEPESTQGRYEGTHNHKESIRVDGAPQTITETLRGKDPTTGNFQENVFLDKITGVGGGIISPAEITAVSYTGIQTPEGLLVECYNPWDLHDYRLCCMKIDSRQTDLGFWLCQECKPVNDELIRKHKRWWDFRDYDYC